MQHAISCWCGNHALDVFSPEYLRCISCNTLVSQVGLTPEKIVVKNDEEDFYGKNYWLSHQSEDLGYPDIFRRSRTDLSERCLHWLKAILKYKFAPATSIELGCAHGAFVGLLRQCGFDAQGLEMSPWIAEFARNTFQIPMHTGPIEEQTIPSASLDMIAMMDVLEHLPNPIATIRKCLDLLKPDGILVIQTPNYPIEKTHAQMVANNDVFLAQLKSDEHLYLFSQDSIESFFQHVSDAPIYIQFEPAIFSQYDMFMMVSKQPLKTHSEEAIQQFLSSSPQTRIVQAMLDLAEQRDSYIRLFQQADMDRIARLETINALTKTK